MGTRTSETAVREIIATSLTGPQIRAFIADSNLWVTEELTSESLSDERLEIIERYLAAALIRLRDLGLKSASLSDVSEQYQVDPDVTDYLLRAASFDKTGTIRQHFLEAAGGGGIVVKFRVGTTYAAALAATEEE
jgi:hypothetical protein